MATFERVIPSPWIARPSSVRSTPPAANPVLSGRDVPIGEHKVRVGDAPIWLYRVTAEHHLDSPLVVDVANSGLVVHVDDVDALYERARSAGAHIDSEPVDQPYASVSMGRGTSKVTGGGLPHRHSQAENPT